MLWSILTLPRSGQAAWRLPLLAGVPSPITLEKTNWLQSPEQSKIQSVPLLDTVHDQAYHSFVPPPLGGGVIEGSTMRDQKLKQAILNRLKSIEGHVRGIE